MAVQAKQTGMGYVNFNAGFVRVLAERCLRKADLPTDCRICIDGCPARALVVNPASDAIKPNKDCIRCGLCVELCPTAAISASREASQRLARRLQNAALTSPHVVITCERTLGLARKCLEGDEGAGSLTILEEAQKKDLLTVVPCLGMMGPEVLFSVLNEMCESAFEQMDILLPLSQCEECPVNETDLAEGMAFDAVSTAELWSGCRVGSLESVEELLNRPEPLLAPLAKIASDGRGCERREIFSGVFKSLSNVWNAPAGAPAGEQGKRLTAAEEAAIRRKRQEASKKTILKNTAKSEQVICDSQELPWLHSAINRARVAPAVKRRLLIDSLGYNATNAASVSLTVSSTDENVCEGCGQCVLSCALKAREIDGESQTASVNPLICTGCSSCIAACSHSAISLTAISGEVFLL